VWICRIIKDNEDKKGQVLPDSDHTASTTVNESWQLEVKCYLQFSPLSKDRIKKDK
jgi:hypothetical protein